VWPYRSAFDDFSIIKLQSLPFDQAQLKEIYAVTSSVPNGAERARGNQRRSQESDLLTQFAPCCRVWRLAAPDTTTGQVRPTKELVLISGSVGVMAMDGEKHEQIR
jgi:hypothetical protein